MGHCLGEEWTTAGPERACRQDDDAERARIVAVLSEPRFVDLAPAQVYATLLDEGVYMCSIRQMYRLLHERDLVLLNYMPPKKSSLPGGGFGVLGGPRCLDSTVSGGRLVPFGSRFEGGRQVLRTVNQPTLWDAVLPPQVLTMPPELEAVDALLDDPVCSSNRPWPTSTRPLAARRPRSRPSCGWVPQVPVAAGVGAAVCARAGLDHAAPLLPDPR